MTEYHQYHEDPASTFGGFLLLVGFLVTAFALIVGFLAASGVAAARGATALQSAVEALSIYVTPIALTGLVLVFLGLALDLRRMARTLHDTAEHAVSVVEDLSHAERRREHSPHVIPVVRHTEPTTDSLARPEHQPTIRPTRTSSPPASRPAHAVMPAAAARSTGTVSPAAMPRPGSSGTRALHIPTAARGENAAPWSGGPGAPPPGPEPGQQPPAWHEEQSDGTPSARPESWRHSRARVTRG